MATWPATDPDPGLVDVPADSRWEPADWADGVRVDDDVEVLAGSPRTGMSRRLRVVTSLVAVLALVLSSGALWAQRHERSREYAALISCIGSAQGAVSTAALATIGARSDPTAPVSTDRVLSSSLVRRAAASGAADVRKAQRTCSRLRVMPWNRGLVRAKQAYVAYVARDLAWLEAVRREGALVTDPGLITYFERAIRLVRAAAPDAQWRTKASQDLPLG